MGTHPAELSAPWGVRESALRLRTVLEGAVVGEHYRVGDKLAEGGMGCIYRATDLRDGRSVAVKVLRGEMAAMPQVRQRFLNEARATMSIAHEHVVEIMAVGELPDGSTFYVMELLEGRTLDACFPLPLEASLAVALQLCDGLAAAHDHGVVHRDLKPENVMVCAGADGRLHCKLIDFGIAKTTFSCEMTLPGQVMGTPAYLAPEQARGHREIGPRADVYAIGVLLYELISGRLPFEGDNALQLLIAHQCETPAPLTCCPPDLAAAVMRCLHKNPEARFGSMRELAAVLRAAAGHAPPPRSRRRDDDEITRTVMLQPVLTPSQPPAPMPQPERISRPPASIPLPPSRLEPPPWLVPVLVLVTLVITLLVSFAILTS